MCVSCENVTIYGQTDSKQMAERLKDRRKLAIVRDGREARSKAIAKNKQTKRVK